MCVCVNGIRFCFRCCFLATSARHPLPTRPLLERVILSCISPFLLLRCTQAPRHVSACLSFSFNYAPKPKRHHKGTIRRASKNVEKEWERIENVQTMPSMKAQTQGRGSLLARGCWDAAYCCCSCSFIGHPLVAVAVGTVPTAAWPGRCRGCADAPATRRWAT